MKKSIIVNKKHTSTNIKFLMMILIIVVGFGIHNVFAADVGESGNLLGELSGVIDELFQIASRIWIPIATLAGKFMSNDMIYASWLHLDSYLWQMWNISKNFANFGIAGFILYKVLESIISKKNELKSIIGKAIVAGILIQMSWFLTAAVIDISTITTTAIGSLPAAMLSESKLESEMNTMIETTMMKSKVVIDEKGKAKLDKRDDTEQTTDMIKNMLLPKYNSVGGPLMFIGASALNIQDMISINENAKRDAKSMLINFGIKGFILIIFTVILLLLLIANIMRVGYLWIFIITSPLVILITTMGGRKDGLLKSSFLKTISLKNFITMVFKPTLFVGVLGILLIFIVSLQSVLNDDVKDINGVSITANSDGTSKFEIKGVTSITTNEKIIDVVGQESKSIFASLIVYFGTLFLLRFLVKISISGGDDPIAGTMKKATGFVEEAAGNLQLPGGLGYNNLKKKSELMIKKGADAAAKGIFSDDISFNATDGSFKSKQWSNYVDGLTGRTNGRSENDIKKLNEIANKTGGNFLSETKNLIQTNGTWLSGDWYKDWKTDLNDRSTKNKEIFGGRKFEEFKEEDLAKLHKELGGGTNSIPKTGNEFDQIDYSDNDVKKDK